MNVGRGLKLLIHTRAALCYCITSIRNNEKAKAKKKWNLFDKILSNECVFRLALCNGRKEEWREILIRFCHVHSNCIEIAKILVLLQVIWMTETENSRTKQKCIFFSLIHRCITKMIWIWEFIWNDSERFMKMIQCEVHGYIILFMAKCLPVKQFVFFLEELRFYLLLLLLSRILELCVVTVNIRNQRRNGKPNQKEKKMK